jgi:hypothetical protein
MKTKIENLKQELREFIELSKTVTGLPWKQADDCVDRGGNHKALIAIFGRHAGITREQDERDAAFIARSRNISPAMAECLLVAVNGLDRLYDDTEGCADGAPDAADHDKLCNEVAHAAKFHLQQILTIWEAAK